MTYDTSIAFKDLSEKEQAEIKLALGARIVDDILVYVMIEGLCEGNKELKIEEAIETFFSRHNLKELCLEECGASLVRIATEGGLP